MKTISFKVTDEEDRSIRGSARSERVSLSEFLRRRAVSRPVPSKVEKIRCSFTGAEIFAPLAKGQPLSTESVRAMLAEFP